MQGLESRSGCLATLFFISLAIASSASAQSGGSPTIAPFSAGAQTNGPSPLFNWADGFWNLGEGFPPPDTGGVISPSNPALLQRTDLTILKSWGPRTNDPNNVWHLVAEIRPQGVGTPEAFGASFEIVIPGAGFTDAVKRQRVVLLIANQATYGTGTNYDPHIYSGIPTNDGLWSDFPWPGGPLFVAEFAAASATNAPFYVVAGYIVPRTSFQPLVFSVQRLRELRRAMMMLIDEFYTAQQFALPSYTSCIAGGSFGGLTTQAASSNPKRSDRSASSTRRRAH